MKFQNQETISMNWKIKRAAPNLVLARKQEEDVFLQMKTKKITSPPLQVDAKNHHLLPLRTHGWSPSSPPFHLLPRCHERISKNQKRSPSSCLQLEASSWKLEALQWRPNERTNHCSKGQQLGLFISSICCGLKTPRTPPIAVARSLQKRERRGRHEGSKNYLHSAKKKERGAGILGT